MIEPNGGQIYFLYQMMNNIKMTTYIPYFYIIQHITSGKYYAGVKYAENSNPDTFLQPNGYQTSSKIIQNIIFRPYKHKK